MTIFAAEVEDDYLVLELGTNHHGEIRTLTGMARPDVAVITNCSEEHLEFLEDMEGVRRENASVVEGLGSKGWLIVNGDDPAVLKAVAHHPRARTMTFGLGEDNDLVARRVRTSAEGIRFWLNGEREVFVPLLGRHNAVNALAALAVARRLGVEEEMAIAGLAQAPGPEMRLELQRVGGVMILNDAYNANPASMRAALETLGGFETRGRRMAVLGDMRELGPTSEQYHRELGELVARLELHVLACVGEHAALIAEAARGAGATYEIQRFDSAGDAALHMAQGMADGDVVLLKGSRAMRLEAVAKALAERVAVVEGRR